MATSFNTTPPCERLNDLFVYDEETGLLVNRRNRGTRGLKGKVAGTLRADGYREVSIDGKLYKQHRIAWKMAYGEDPPQGMEIHHGPGGPSDNRLANLRLETHRGNCSIEKVARSGLPVGVARSKNRYKAYISLEGKIHHLGCYDTPEEASEAYQSALEANL